MTRLESLTNKRAHLIALADVARAKGDMGAAVRYCNAAMDASYLLEQEQRRMERITAGLNAFVKKQSQASEMPAEFFDDETGQGRR